MSNSAAMRTLFMRLIAQYKGFADDAEHNLWPLVDRWKQLPDGKLKERFGRLAVDQDYVVKSLRGLPRIGNQVSPQRRSHGIGARALAWNACKSSPRSLSRSKPAPAATQPKAPSENHFRRRHPGHHRRSKIPTP